jgi:hypothetical protein
VRFEFGSASFQFEVTFRRGALAIYRRTGCDIQGTGPSGNAGRHVVRFRVGFGVQIQTWNDEIWRGFFVVCFALLCRRPVLI